MGKGISALIVILFLALFYLDFLLTASGSLVLLRADIFDNLTNWFLNSIKVQDNKLSMGKLFEKLM